MSAELALWEVLWLLQWRSSAGSAKYCRECHRLSDEIADVSGEGYRELSVRQAREHMQDVHPMQLQQIEIRGAA